MSLREKVNILLVDDQPAKLLSLRAILGDLGENLLVASSADEALTQLLSTDVAVVLVDVCMPKMDGFELAELIRGHPRFGQTAIIFISAVQFTDADRLRGYGLGAVDYIPVPIVPEVLRAKVMVFAELHRKSLQLERLNRELEERVAERTADLEASTQYLRDSEQRYRQLVHGLAAAVYTCDASGKILLYNEAAVQLWGRRPEVDKDEWCGSWRIYRPDGTLLPIDQCPMAITLREGRAVRGDEIMIERPDGSRRIVLPSPEPIFDASGALVGAVNLLQDITDTRAAEQAQILLAAIVACSDDAIISRDLEGAITSWNAGAQRIFGYTQEEVLGRQVSMLIPPERRVEDRAIFDRIRRGDRVDHHETLRIAKDGRQVDVELTISPLYDPKGRLVGTSKVARDITQRKRAEAILARDRETLERLIAERTSELEQSTQRLRHSDRMATIGTLSAGLGHDLGNLLFPVRMRLDSIERCELSERVREDVTAIRKATDYLQRLAANLRLLSLDPQNDPSDTAATDLGKWWAEVEGMLRNGVSRPATLEADIAADLPGAKIGKASLTQVIFNLVQNAGDALKGRADGRVVLKASSDPSGGVVLLSVSDNGPGMNDEVKRRCIEPFFTTKTRGMSTGLGLALVSGIVKNAGGSVQIRSTPDKGTTFEILLPAAELQPGASGAFKRRSVAVVTVKDRTLLSHIESALESMSFIVRVTGKPDDADVWVMEAPDQTAFEAARRFAGSGPDRRAVVFGFEERESKDAEGRVLVLEPHVKPSVLRSRICGALGGSDIQRVGVR